MRLTPLRSGLVELDAELSMGAPLNFFPTHFAESIDLAMTTWSLAPVMRNSREWVPLPNSDARRGPMGVRSRNQASAPCPGIGYEMTTTCPPLTGSRTGAITVGAVATSQLWLL